MEKPFTLRINDFINDITEVINNAEFPAYVVKNILEMIYKNVCEIDEQEINAYNEKIKESKEK